MGKTNGYSLQELEDLTGFQGRTIRSYIQRGLIPGAIGRGRGATYCPESIDGLLFIRAVRQVADLNLDQLRRLMLQLSPERIRAIGRGEEAIDIFSPEGAPVMESHFSMGMASFELDESSAPVRAAQSTAPEPITNDALDFIKRIRSKTESRPYTQTISTHPTSRLARAAMELEKTLSHRKPVRKARGEWWVNIPITPDIELRARGLDGDELTSLERIADTLRNLISRNK